MAFWAMRTDRNNKEVIWHELSLGRLRQGWGHDRSQDLRVVDKIWNWEGGDWNQLTEDQHYAAGHFHMLGKYSGSMQPNDIVLLPNLPNDGWFSICRLTEGPYEFEPLSQTGDHGHIRSAAILTPQGIDKYDPNVHAQLRKTLRTPSRLWSVGVYQEHIELLIEAAESGVQFNRGVFVQQRIEALIARVHDGLNQVRASELGAFRDFLKAGELERLFEAGDWEHVLKAALTALYPTAEVFHTGGAGEQGADLIIQLPNAFCPALPLLIPVQVKHHEGISPDWPLDQLRQAIMSYRRGSADLLRDGGRGVPADKGGDVIMAVLATTADYLPPEFKEKMALLERDLSVPVRVFLRDELVDLIARGLFAQASTGG